MSNRKKKCWQNKKNKRIIEWYDDEMEQCDCGYWFISDMNYCSVCLSCGHKVDDCWSEEEILKEIKHG